MLIVRLLTVEQHTVVHEPHTSECLSKILFLLKRRIETVLVGFMLVHDLHGTIESCKNKDAYVPLPKGRGITRILIKLKILSGKTSLGIERSTFLIDKQGILRQAWRKVAVKNHAQTVLEAARTL